MKCRKPHKCMGGCDKEIAVGEYAICETGFMDGRPVSTYTCTDCMDKWIDEINGSEEEPDGRDYERDCERTGY